jgi:hypothetical protein
VFVQTEVEASTQSEWMVNHSEGYVSDSMQLCGDTLSADKCSIGRHRPSNAEEMARLHLEQVCVNRAAQGQNRCTEEPFRHRSQQQLRIIWLRNAFEDPVSLVPCLVHRTEALGKTYGACRSRSLQEQWRRVTPPEQLAAVDHAWSLALTSGRVWRRTAAV